ncbi:MAG: phosphomannose isomerase type II C-terminal cupin domain [Thermoplasmatota archaeon]
MGVKEKRPWGSFEVLSESSRFKVKVLEVMPGKRLSYQRHGRRDERWTVVEGIATVVLDDEESEYTEGDVVMIERMRKHRVENRGKEVLRIVEVQIGDYFGEDDIERFQDDYGRS